MARKVMKETWYTFDPANRIVTFPHYVPQEHLILITDITANKVLYNFSDPSLGYSSYSSIVNADGTETTSITLKYNTASLASSDEIQVVIDEYIEQFAGSEEMMDGVGKLKTSTPQALIDTDFEYGSQQSKWESISTVNNRPTSYGYNYQGLNISSITTGAAGSKTVTVALNASTASTATVPTQASVTAAYGNGPLGQTTYSAANHGFSVGQYVAISGAATAAYNTTPSVPAQIIAVPNANTFVVNSTNAITSGSAAIAFSGGATAVTGTAIAGIVPPIGTPINVIDTFYNGSAGRYTVEALPTISITAISAGTGTQVTYSTTTPPAVGQVVNISGTIAQGGGTYVVQSVVAGTSFTVNNSTTTITTSAQTGTILSQFTYTAKYPANTTWASTNIFDQYKTLVLQETLYSNSFMPMASIPTYVSNASGSAVTVTTTNPHGLSIGNEIAIVGTSGVTSGTATTSINGSFSVATVISPTQFAFYTPSTLSGTLAISGSATGTAASGSVGIVNSNIFAIGAITGAVAVGMSVSGVGVPTGAYVTNILTGSGASTSMVTISQPLTASVTASTYTFSASIFMRPQGQVQHRAFDGGVLFQSNAGSNNNLLMRQTRRYFRYQSGKAISMSSGTILKPTLNIDSMTASGTTITVVTKERHNLQPGYQVTVYGSTDTTLVNSVATQTYNGIFNVVNVLGPQTFTYTATTAPTLSPSPGTAYVSTSAWYGAQTRLGIFDNQNGAYWEFDGQKVYAVRRSSVYQIAGRVTVTQGSATITGSTQNPTTFSKQLLPGDWIVLRGQSYRVQDIASDTSLIISPTYRGPSASQVVVSKTVNTKIPQASFNIDQLDGHGPTGYNLDLSKMQMFFIDFSWYGAGAIRWGLRTNKGNIAWVHKLPNNNANATAYMRSGNLPARYESSTYPSATYITSNVLSTDTTINVADTSAFPTSGTLVLRPGNSAASGSGGNGTANYELINYTGTTSTSFTGVTRAQAGQVGATFSPSIAAGTNTGAVVSATGIQIGQRVISSSFPEGTFVNAVAGTNITFSNAATAIVSTVTFAPMASTAQAYSYQATAPVTVELAYPTYGPGLSHWGTSVIIDGKYDDDKSLLFTYGQTTPTQLAPSGGTTATASTSSGAVVTISANTNIVPGMQVSGTNVPDGTYVVAVTSSTSITLNQNPTATLTSVLLTFYGSSSKALLSMRISPSVDNGIPSGFGNRELINRMQLILKTLDISLLNTTTGNVLVQAYLNGTPVANTYSASSTNIATTWTNAIKNAVLTPSSSLAQIADYAGTNVNIVGGEVTGGFFVNSTGTSDISQVRDLGNSILGGGYGYSNVGVYPDGPDTLTLVVTNLSTTPVSVLGRVSWTEAQA